jgi:hypothetical protein
MENSNSKSHQIDHIPVRPLPIGFGCPAPTRQRGRASVYTLAMLATHFLFHTERLFWG